MYFVLVISLLFSQENSFLFHLANCYLTHMLCERLHLYVLLLLQISFKNLRKADLQNAKFLPIIILWNST